MADTRMKPLQWESNRRLGDTVRSVGLLMKYLICAAVAAASTLLAPTAAATPCQGVINQSGCNPAPWNGQQMDTWNIPGTYGGWTNTPIMCNPQTAKCAMWGQP